MSYYATILYRDEQRVERIVQIDAPDALTLKARIDRAREEHGDKDGFDVADAWQRTVDGKRPLLVAEHSGPRYRKEHLTTRNTSS